MSRRRRLAAAWLAPGSLIAVAAVLALHAVLWWIELQPRPRGWNGDEIHYLRLAAALRAGEPAPFDPLWPPAYPWFLAALVGGTGLQIGVRLAQLALLVAVALLLGAIARRLGASPTASRGLALFTLGYPPLASFAYYFWPEVVHLSLFLAAVWILLARAGSLAWAPIAGVALGAALLTKSLLVPYWPLLLVPLLFTDPPRHRRLTAAALVVAALFLTVAPTLVANHRQTGRYLLAGSGAFNLWVGLNDRSRQSLADSVVWREYQRYRDSAPTWPERQEVLWTQIRGLVAERGVGRVLQDQLARQYFRLFDKESYLTAQLPGGALASGKRGYHDTPPAVAGLLRGASYALYALLLVGAACGLVWRLPWDGAGSSLSRTQRAWLWVLAGFLAYNLALFLLLHVKSRYRIQLYPVFALYGALAWDALQAARQGDRPLSPRQKLAAGVAAAGALFLAFGGSW